MEKTLLRKRLKELRTKYGYAQEDIALFLGVERNVISEYESGERLISVDALEDLGELYGCDLIHEPSVETSAIQTAFHADSSLDMKTIQVLNRIILNSIFMANLLKQD